MVDEERFTLTEARQKLAEKECSVHGHTWEVVTLLSGIPTKVFCDRCGRSYRVAEQP